MSDRQKILELKLSIHELEARLNRIEKKLIAQEVLETTDARLEVLEAFHNNIKLITTDIKEIQ